MLPHLVPLLQLLFFTPLVFAQDWTANPFIPPATPLAVRGPYLQTWLQQAAANNSLNSWWQYYRDGTVGHLPPLLQRNPETE